MAPGLPLPTAAPVTTPLAVAKGEAGIVRVFALRLEAAVLRDLLARPAADQPLVMDRILGARIASPRHVEILRTADLGRMGLPGYLAQAHDVAPAVLARDGSALANPRAEAVLIVDSAAFAGSAQRLNPDPGIDLLAALPTALAQPARLQAAERPRAEMLGTATPRPAPGLRLPGWPALLSVLAAVGVFLLLRAL